MPVTQECKHSVRSAAWKTVQGGGGEAVLTIKANVPVLSILQPNFVCRCPNTQSLQPAFFRPPPVLRPNFPANPQFYHPEHKQGRLLPLPTSKLATNRPKSPDFDKYHARLRDGNQNKRKKKKNNLTCMFAACTAL